MSHTLDVYVLDGDGDPISGERVGMIIEGFWKGGGLEEHTDDEGHADFETADDYDDSRSLKIFVRGESFGPFSIGDG